ncbi:MAG: alpha-L-arabinofuranosidase C-terminal domain-containing protein [Candidatus Poribacteria bacterium]
MDEYDPERKIGLLVDEWGTWHPPTEGREPSFLWQQNTLRDALVAALTLDIFNRHADKVVMGNIAQTINVLQAMILTEGDKMLTTPTFQIYEMYAQHQGGQSLKVSFDVDDITFSVGDEELQFWGLNGSASLTDKTLCLTVVNPHAENPIEATIHLSEGKAKEAKAQVLTHDDIHAHNTFDEPQQVTPYTESLSVTGKTFQHSFPPASVTKLLIQLA